MSRGRSVMVTLAIGDRSTGSSSSAYMSTSWSDMRAANCTGLATVEG